MKSRGVKVVTLKQLEKKFGKESLISKPVVVPAKQQQLIRKNVDSSIRKTVVLDHPAKQQLIRKNDESNNKINGSCLDSSSEKDADLSPFVSFLEETLSSPKSVLKENNTEKVIKKLIKTEHPGGVTNEVKERKTGGSIMKPGGGKISRLEQLRNKFANQSSIIKQQQLIRKNVASNDWSISKTVVLDRPKQQQQPMRKNVANNGSNNNMNGSCFDSCSGEDVTLSPFVSFLEETLCSPKSVLREDSTKKKLIKTDHPGVTKKRKTEHLCLGDRIAASYKTKNVKPPKYSTMSKKLNEITDGLTKKSTSHHTAATVRNSTSKNSIAKPADISCGEKRKSDQIENNQLAKKRKTEDCRLEANKKKDTPRLLLATNVIPSCLTEAMEWAKRRRELNEERAQSKLLNEERLVARALRDAMERGVVIVDNFQVMKDFWMLTGSNGDGVVMGPCRLYR